MKLRFHSGIGWRVTAPLFLCTTLCGLRRGQIYVFTVSEVHDRCLAVTFSGFGVATGLVGPCHWCTDALRMLHIGIRCRLWLPSFFRHIYILFFVTVCFGGSVGAQTLCRPPYFAELSPFLRLLPQAKPEAQSIFTY